MLNVLHTQEEVNDRLSQMEIPVGTLSEAIWQGYLARTRTTSNHPRIFRGITMWAETVAVLRDQLRSHGWNTLDEGNYSRTVNSNEDLAIVVATGDEATGDIHASPSNKCPKGINTTEAVETNNQLDLFNELLPDVVDTEGVTTWVLLTYLTAEELRAELSLPSSISSGKINGWKERIILPSMSLNDDSVEIELPDLPDIEVSIRKKA